MEGPLRLCFKVGEYFLILHFPRKYHTVLNYTIRLNQICAVFTGIPKGNVQSVTPVNTCIGI